MGMQVGKTPDPTPPAGGGKGAASPAEIKGQITSQLAKATAALNNLSANTSTAKGLATQADQNIQIAKQAENLQSEINTLQSSGQATPDEINALQTQLAGLVQVVNQLNSATASIAFTTMTAALEAPAGAVPAPGSPVLVVPLANVRQQSTVQEQAALFLTPSLVTAIFRIMENVEHQKIENIDVMRQFSWNSTAGTEQEALNAAQSTVLQGQLQAIGQRATAMGTIVQAGLGMALGVASIVATSTSIGTLSAKYKEQDDKLEAQQEGTDRLDPPEYQKQKQNISMERQQAISNELQSNWFLRVLQVSEQSLPQMAQGIAGMVAAGYTVEAAYAEAAKMLYQQAIQAYQSQTQTAQEYIQAASQDLQSFFQTFGSISAGLTQQS